MKRILLYLVCVFALIAVAGCSKKVVYVDSSGNVVPEPNGVYVNDSYLSNWKLKTITINGETHEFLVTYGAYTYAIGHWPGCKYCKQNENENKLTIND